MTVKELQKLLETANPEAEVLIDDNGSTLKTAAIEESEDFNKTADSSEFFIVCEEY